MLAAAARGPSQRPASTTTNGCSVNGTAVPGIGRVTCAAAASAAAKPTTPTRVTLAARGSDREIDVMGAWFPWRWWSDALDAHRDGVAAAEAERGESRARVAVLHGVQQRREHARAARADRVAERDRAAVHVDAVPVPAEPLPVGERLRGEGLVRLDELEVADLAARLLHEVAHRVDGREEELLRLRAPGGVARDAREDLEPVRAGELLARHHERRRAVVHRRGVAGRHALLVRRQVLRRVLRE